MATWNLTPIHVAPASGNVPGLWDVQMSDGSWRNDLTTGQAQSLVGGNMATATCPGCGASRWYGVGPCSSCGAPMFGGN